MRSYHYKVRDHPAGACFFGLISTRPFPSARRTLMRRSAVHRSLFPFIAPHPKTTTISTAGLCFLHTLLSKLLGRWLGWLASNRQEPKGANPTPPGLLHPTRFPWSLSHTQHAPQSPRVMMSRNFFDKFFSPCRVTSYSSMTLHHSASNNTVQWGMSLLYWHADSANENVLHPMELLS